VHTGNGLARRLALSDPIRVPPSVRVIVPESVVVQTRFAVKVLSLKAQILRHFPVNSGAPADNIRRPQNRTIDLNKETS